tara:strand:- start:740 stop:850 length:111 start_codon:yes stop_codon:yes gene_type:complete
MFVGIVLVIVVCIVAFYFSRRLNKKSKISFKKVIRK